MELKPGASLQQGKYIIISKLGQGGFGITYLAEQPALGRHVAVKEFFPKSFCNRDTTSSRMVVGVSSQAASVTLHRQKFLKEAQNIARLSHNGIIRIYDIFAENDTAYYIMEYMPAGSLKDYVARNGALGVSRAMGYVRQLADTLRFVHNHNITHLDIKPGNILLSDDDRPVLIDFGLSKRYDSEGGETSASPIGRSQGYSAPEQYMDGALRAFSPATDVYALTATLYTMLTGEVPPPSLSIPDMGPEEFPGDRIPVSLRDVIRKGMAPRRDRYATVDELMRALENAVVSESAVADDTVMADGAGDSGTDVPDESVGDSNPAAASGNTARRHADETGQPPKKRRRWIFITIMLFAAVMVFGLITLWDRIGTGDGEPEGPASPVTVNIASGRAEYTGPVDEEGKPHGRGEALLLDSDSCRYSGEFVHGVMHGEAEVRYRDGAVFKGSYADDDMQRGTMEWPDGTVFKGSFRKGGMLRMGTVTYPDGERFEGLFGDDQQPAHGKMYDAAGNVIQTL